MRRLAVHAMTVTAGWKSDVEVHPPDWCFPAANSWVAGWIRPVAGQVVTDVRARLHHRVILGLAGLPHPVFAGYVPGHPDSSGAGFSFLFTPQPGATLLRLEARDRSGEWTEFFRTKISAAPDASVLAPGPDLGRSLGQLVAVLLQQRIRTPRRSWVDLADDRLAVFVAEPLNTHPNPPFVGALEEPLARGRLHFGRVPVNGWLAHPAARITRISAVVDPLPAVTLPHGPARHDIAGVFPALGAHANSAFGGEIVLPPDLAAPVLLKIFAELDNGERHLVFARRFTPRYPGSDGTTSPLVPGFTYFRGVWELLRSARRHALPRQNLLQTARTVWTGYTTMPVYRPGSFSPPAEKPPGASRGPARPIPIRAAPSAAGTPTAAGGGTITCPVIAPADDMFVSDAAQYFRIGQEALALAQAANTRAGGGQIESILDLPCGFGRVARWLRTAYPTAQLTVSDTQEPGVAFCVEHLGATGVLANVDGRHWENLPGPYDLIWCGSLLTHFDWDEWVNHLRRFAERLAPHGVLVFTSHGLPVLDRLQRGEKDYGLTQPEVARLWTAAVADGFGYVAYPDTPAYGISVAQPGWIRKLIARETDLQVLDYRVTAWDQHQDIVVCTRRL